MRRLMLVGLSILLAGVAIAHEWQTSPAGRSAALTVAARGKPGFTQMQPAATGITFSNLLSIERYTTNQIYLNGSGLAAGDVDGDGWCDLYFCGLDNDNVLYRNIGNWKFEDITAKAGAALTGRASTGAAF